MQRAASADAAELRRNLADQFWRLNNLYRFINADGKLVTFKLNRAQEQFYREMHFLNIILKARQLGFTTFMQLFMLDECLFNTYTRCGTIADNLETARQIFKDKIKVPYEALPDQLKARVRKIDDNALELSLSNNSRLRVGTSLRGGTFNFLHVSELGKIAAKYPQKAREIRTGAFNTIHAGQVITVESTAEGQEGDFFDMCQLAQSKARMGSRLTELDFKFHFYPWHEEPAYDIDPEGVIISPEHAKRFARYEEEHGIILRPGQKAWWVKKSETQQEDMGREYPTTPEEAFEASVEGSYYGATLAKAEAQGRIGTFKALEGLPVHTAWDIGRSDATCIWFFQVMHKRIRVVGYFENSGEAMPYYAKEVKRLYSENGWLRNDDSRDWWPHDGKVEEWGTGKTRVESGIEHGLRPKVPRAMSLHDGINAVREDLAICEFDEEGCADGLKVLRNYRKQWDEPKAMWSNEPFHNWASHGADAIRTMSVAVRDPGPDKPEKTQEEINRAAIAERLRLLEEQKRLRQGRA